MTLDEWKKEINNCYYGGQLARLVINACTNKQQELPASKTERNELRITFCTRARQVGCGATEAMVKKYANQILTTI